MPSKCSAGYCDVGAGDGVPMYSFPKPEETGRRGIWAKFVQKDRKKRPNEDGKEWQPLATSKLCANHFE